MKRILLTLFIVHCSLFIAVAQPPSNLNGLKICIDPGHGGFGSNDRRIEPDPGNVFWESEGNFRKALWLRPMLQGRGATVFLTRETNDYPTDVDPTLTQRWQFANANNVHWFHSIHSNATGLPLGNNTSTNYTLVLLKEDTLTRQPAFPAAVDMSSLMYTNIRAKNRTSASSGNIPGKPGVYLDFTFYGGPNRGFNLGVLKGLLMPGQLSEGSFHDFYPETRRLLNNDYRKGEAYGIYNGFVEYFKIPFDTLGIICGTQKNGTTPINNIVVRLLPLNKVYNGDTYNNGYFMFDSLPPGNYKVIFETPGVAQDTVSVTLSATPRTIIATQPIDKSTNINRDQQIVLTFVKAMDTASVRAAFSISPAVAGTFAWSNNNFVLTFAPSSLLPYKASYTVSVAGLGNTPQPTVFVDNKTVTSNVGTASFTFTFQTQSLPPYLLLTQPKPNDTSFVVTQALGLKFSETMDTASVRAAFSITPDIGGIFTWSQNNTTLLIKPASGVFEYNTNYTATVGATAKSIFGLAIDGNKDTIPGDPFVLQFRTQNQPTGIAQNSLTPVEFSLGQNYPNPFNPATTLQFSVAEFGLVSLKVYDMLGREVTTLTHNTLDAGRYSVSFDASDLPSGVYFYRLTTEKFTDVKRMMLVK